MPSSSTKENTNIPPPPEKPDPYECCGSGCVPCIWDYYFDRLECWQADNNIRLEDYLAENKDR